LTDMIINLQSRAVVHDHSKLQSPEREAYNELTPKLRCVSYGTKEYKTILQQFRPAIDHHYAHNRHHPEYYSNGIAGMSLLDLLEMLADWKASSDRIPQAVSLEKAFNINKERFKIDPVLYGIMWNTAKELGWL
jgi:Family of unknown function (DUF5662)